MRRSYLFFIIFPGYSVSPLLHPLFRDISTRIEISRVARSPFLAVSKGGLACLPPLRERVFQMTSQNASLREGEQVSLRSDGEDDDDDDDGGEPM